MAQDRDRRLELPEPERDRSGGIGRHQKRMIHAVGYVRLDRGRSANPHLLDGLKDLDGPQQRERGGDLGGGHPGREPRHLGSRNTWVDNHPREVDDWQRHRFLGNLEVDSAPRDELVEQVELGLGDTVELDDPAVLDSQRRLRVERARERDQAKRRVFRYQLVLADRPVSEELRASGRAVVDGRQLISGRSGFACRSGFAGGRDCDPGHTRTDQRSSSVRRGAHTG